MAPQELTMAGSAVAPSERTLLGEQTAGSLIRNVWAVYRRHFLRIGLIFVLPVYPLVALGVLVSSGFLLAFEVLVYVAWGALTIAVSDVCLGTVPSVRRSYSQVLRRRTWLKLFTAALLTALLTYLGLLLVLVGYVWVYVRLIFAATVVALEQRTARVAIRRSWGLTRGQFWRLFGLLMLTAVVFLVVALPLFVVGIGVGSLASSDLLAETLVWLPLIVLVAPAVSIAVVLLYYDQRVRRESYDAAALSEDMMR